MFEPRIARRAFRFPHNDYCETCASPIPAYYELATHEVERTFYQERIVEDLHCILFGGCYFLRMLDLGFALILDGPGKKFLAAEGFFC